MDEETKITTVQVDSLTSAKLKALAQAYKRSKTAQLAWLVEREYEALRSVKLVDEVPAVQVVADARGV